MRRTRAHQLYVEPTAADIKLRFRELGFELPYSIDLVRDIANVVSHVQAGENIANSMLNVRNMIDPKQYKSKEEYESAISYHENVQQFISNLDFSKFTGNTPLAKAASVVAALSAQEGGRGDESSQPIPIFSKSDSNFDQETKKLEEEVENVRKSQGSIYEDFINPDKKSPEILLPTLTNSQKELLANMALLADRSKIKANKRADTQVLNQMTEYSQISRLNSMCDLLMPTFSYKFVSKQLVVRETVQSAKQSLFLLIDDSGSMNKIEKRAWVKALIINRLDAVVRAEAELYICWFVREINKNKVFKITNTLEALLFLHEDFYGSFSKSSTNIEHSLKEACEAIKQGSLGPHKFNAIKPQIVIMNDGEDKIDPNYKPEITTHCFILGEDNKDLKKVVESSGGHYERFL